MQLSPRWAQCHLIRHRQLHSSAVLHSDFRKWSLRVIRKEDVEYAAPRRERPVLRNMNYAQRLMQIADGYVYSELQKKARNEQAPEGRRGRMVRIADRLVEGAGNPFEARGWEAGAKVAGDRRGRLREALRLYLRASQRKDGTMPIISSRVWGTTHFMERRIMETVRRLDAVEKVSRVHYTSAQEDIVNWGVQPRSRMEREKEVREKPLEWVTGAGSPKDVRPSARGLAYKTQQRLPPLHRLTPSAVERAREPVLQAFPGIGNVGGHALSLGHAFFASRGLLGTPSSSFAATSAPGEPFSTTPAAYSGSSAPSTPPTALSHAGDPRPYYTYPGPSPTNSTVPSTHPSLRPTYVSTLMPGHGVASLVTKTQHTSPSSSSPLPTSGSPDAHPAGFLAHPDPTALRGPPWTRRGKMLRWTRLRKKREDLVKMYFPAPHPEAPMPPVVESAGASVMRRDTLNTSADAGEGGTELAAVRQPVNILPLPFPPTLTNETDYILPQPPRQPSLAHALRVRLAGRMRV
ncbi:hypothetical protein K438DRAFT_2019692 [Mycena galopus ATCC 62051]|nr:hypothetical protein K438DRAFT_2019692 [Mycena galopus ATCC 62051]